MRPPRPLEVAVIPARGGSKRIPRKNIRAFAGRPVIEWSILAATSSGLFDDVIVSTDDDEIAAVARQAGAQVPFKRPAELSDDHSTTADVLEHSVRWLDAEGRGATAVCCLYATAPFVKAHDLARARQLLDVEHVDYTFGAARFTAPVQRAFLEDADGGVRMLWPEHGPTRSQDLPPVYHDAGQFYWGRAAAWRQRRPIFSDRSRFVELSPWQVQDIDTPEDWTMAEHLFRIARRGPHEFG